MKTIAVTQRVAIDPVSRERRDALDQRWLDFLIACGFCPLPVPNRAEVAVPLAEAAGASGLLMTGGGDLAAYGGDSPERDETERALLAWARERHLPVLGVCRGMEVIQDVFGVGLRKIAGHVGRHRIRTGRRHREVNSFHDLGSRDTVPDLTVWATAADGVVEAVRHIREPILAMMWHPERETPFDERDVKLFREHLG